MDRSMPGFPVHHQLPCPSCSNSCPSNWWCHPTISSSVVPFSSCLQSCPESGSFPVSQFFASDGQRIGVSASASVLPMNIQGWFPLGLTGWIFLQSKGLSRVFSNTTVQKHQFFWWPELSFCHKLCPWRVCMRTKLEFYPTWQKPGVPAQGPIYLLPQAQAPPILHLHSL